MKTIIVTALILISTNANALWCDFNGPYQQLQNCLDQEKAIKEQEEFQKQQERQNRELKDKLIRLQEQQEQQEQQHQYNW
jgi:membrane protein involved in colicin uptake